MSIFDTIAVHRVPRSKFDLSRSHKLSCNMGDLIPVFLEEVVPGDSFRVKTELMVRLAPMLAPIMHRVNIYTHWFYVPNRLVWDNWNDHITGGEDGSANPPFPQIPVNTTNGPLMVAGTLSDYLGVPPFEAGQTVQEEFGISALPFRGYQLIFNEYFRDQDLSPEVEFSTGDDASGDVGKLLTLRKRAWEKDYFTAARPSTQKGADVLLPVNWTPEYKDVSSVVSNNVVTDASGNLRTGNGVDAQQDGFLYQESTDPLEQGGARIENLEETQQNIASTIRDLRASNKLQEWLELAMRGGSRINEVIRNYFGVRPDDLRLTRPQYLGGSKQPIVMSEVLNTAGDLTGTQLQPLGEYGGHGVSVGNQAGFKGKFKEHGYVFGIMSTIPKTEYMQGLHKHWRKFDKFERYWPQFQGIGEQAITNAEIYFDYESPSDQKNATFGYIPRYSEYKFSPSCVSGDFRKDSSGDKLSYWNMARYFDAPPALNDQFVTSDPTHRIFAVTDPDVDKLYVQMYHKVSAIRPMSKFVVPSLV